ncbi:MAG: hypothetical protein ACKVZJ_14300 [Phycisphaerales bacterium]
MPSDLRATGRIIAAVAFTIVAGVIVWSVVNQRRRAAVPAAAPGAAGPATPPSAAVRPGSGLIAGSEKGTWTRASPVTGVIESRLDYNRLTPLENGRYELESPGVWLFDSGVPQVHIGAPRATVVWTVRDEPPEAGDLLGGVTVRVFPKTAPAGGAASTGTTPPLESALYTLAIDSVHFEGALSQLESADPLTIRGPGLSADATGLMLRFSPATSKLEYARTLGKRARIEPAAFRRGLDALSRKSDEKERERAPGSTAGETAAPLQPYELLLAGALKASQGPRTLEAGSLRVWAMLRDGRVAEGAIAPFAQPSPGAAAASSSGEPASSGSGAAGPDELPIEIAWTGPLEIRSLAERPDELAADLLRMRLDGVLPDRPENAERVRLADTRQAFELDAGSIDYRATTRTLAVAAPAGDGLTFLARAGSPDAAQPPIEVRARALSLDLTTGVGAMPGSGSLSSVPAGVGGEGAATPTTVTWKGRADFELDTTNGPAGAGGVFLPTRVTLSDHVRVAATEGAASADLADLRFRRLETAPGKPTAIPAQIVLDGAAEAKTPEGAVRAQRLTLSFHEKPDARGRAVPRVASARGSAVAERQTDDGLERIEARSIDAVLGFVAEGAEANIGDGSAKPGAAGQGRLQVTTINAESSVVFTGKNNLRAGAERLDADVPSRAVALVGTRENPAVISSGVAPDPGKPTETPQSLTAERINLDGAARTVIVPGPGVARYRADTGTSRQSLGVEWLRGMTYNEGTGVATIEGRVVALGERDEHDFYKATADRATLRLSNAAGKSTLDEITLERTGVDAGGANFVEVEARRIKPGTRAAPELEGLVNLRAPALTVLPQAKAMKIPGAGRIILDDRREGATPDPNQSAAFEDLRGKSVVEWTGSLDTLQPSGTLRVEQGVRVRHLPPGASEAMLLEAATLALDLVWPGDGDTNQQPRLSRLSADGGVFVKHTRARLVGSALSFDSTANQVLVAGSPERPVTIEDLQTGATTNADGVRFDPATGTWEAQNVGTITVPR